MDKKTGTRAAAEAANQAAGGLFQQRAPQTAKTSTLIKVLLVAVVCILVSGIGLWATRHLAWLLVGPILSMVLLPPSGTFKMPEPGATLYSGQAGRSDRNGMDLSSTDATAANQQPSPH